MLAMCLIPAAGAAEVKPETVQAWDGYVHTVTAQMQERLAPDHCYLWVDEIPGGARQLRAGKILVAPVKEQPRHVPSGLIHHWIGAVFIPDARLEDIAGVLRDYDHYKDFYSPYVLEAKLLQRDGSRDDFAVVLMNKAVLVKTAVDGDYQSRYFPVDPHRAYSISKATRLQQVENYGQTTQHKLAEDAGSGYLWRLASVTRWEERDGGVYLEVEALALSRDIPQAFRWFVEPIVRRLSRNSVQTSLHQTRHAVNISSTSVAAAGR